MGLSVDTQHSKHIALLLETRHLIPKSLLLESKNLLEQQPFYLTCFTKRIDSTNIASSLLSHLVGLLFLITHWHILQDLVCAEPLS